MAIKERLIMAGLALLFNGTPLIYGILRGQLLPMMVFFAVFGAINFFFEKYNKKNHAEISNDGDEYKDLAACWITSNVLLISCLELAIFTSRALLQWQATLLGACVAIISTLSISKLFFTKPIKINIETKKSLRDELAKMSKTQAREYLYERLPEDEADVLFWLDFQNKTLDFVAFNKIDRSVTALKELRSSAYKRLRHINPDME